MPVSVPPGKPLFVREVAQDKIHDVRFPATHMAGKKVPREEETNKSFLRLPEIT